jgi:FkbM family methyltransferase
MSTPDLTSGFGTFSPGAVGRSFLVLTRALGTTWAATRTRILLRRLARPWLGPCVDTELYGCRARLFLKGNISEKSALFAPHAFDTAERQALAGAGGPGAVFVDVGANVGLYSLFLAREWAHHPDARVLAIEPHPTLRARLAFNLAQNPDLVVEISDVAITASEGPVGLKTCEKNLGQTRLSEEGDVQVQGRPLLAELQQRNISRVDSLKVDVEGAEDQVLVPFLEAAPAELLPRVLVVEDNPHQWSDDLLGWIEKRGLVLQTKTRMNLIFTQPPAADGGDRGADRD